MAWRAASAWTNRAEEYGGQLECIAAPQQQIIRGSLPTSCPKRLDVKLRSELRTTSTPNSVFKQVNNSTTTTSPNLHLHTPQAAQASPTMPRQDPIRALQLHNSPLILDGALATELERRGCALNTALWSAQTLLSRPELIHDVHLSYFLAGADIATTASYQASFLGLSDHGGISASQAHELIKLSVSLAQRARATVLDRQPGRRMLVAGSVGPYGAYLANGAEYRGDYELAEAVMRGFHRGRVEALVEAGVDLLACETMPSFAEVEALLGLLQEFPETVAWVSVTVKDEAHMSDGTPLEKVVRVLNECPQVVAMGVNCIPEDLVAGALSHMAACSLKPLVAYPNSGERYDPVSKTWHGEHLRDGRLQERAAEWHSAGAGLIGGCCRTTPEDIRAVRERLRGSIDLITLSKRGA